MLLVVKSTVDSAESINCSVCRATRAVDSSETTPPLQQAPLQNARGAPASPGRRFENLQHRSASSTVRVNNTVPVSLSCSMRRFGRSVTIAEGDAQQIQGSGATISEPFVSRNQFGQDWVSRTCSRIIC